ncbi:MAG: DNA-3-methyladenine glycosylase [Candidatus Margulisbacteria bacterium]|nr:DNA-3-methyladenine glycosylase [Candidatus Margulisiibacteriota bacterium]
MNFKDLQILPEHFFLQDTIKIARQLLGKYLIKVQNNGKVLGGMIVESEAYEQDDPASHSYRGQTPRNEPMFRKGGISYVYFIYGMYHCFNVVTGLDGVGSAILIRSLEPLFGEDIMKKNRKTDNIKKLTSGPGMLCQALDITRKDNCVNLQNGHIGIYHDRTDNVKINIVQVPRIGIKEENKKLYRFYIKGNEYVSVK